MEEQVTQPTQEQDIAQRLQMSINYCARDLPKMGVCPRCRKTTDLRVVYLEDECRWVFFYQCTCRQIKHTNGTSKASMELTKLVRGRPDIPSTTEEISQELETVDSNNPKSNSDGNKESCTEEDQ